MTMNNVVNFKMILEINQLLNENNIEYSIHGVGGCTCCGLEVRQEGKECSIDRIIEELIKKESSRPTNIYILEPIHSKFDKKP